MPFIEVVPPENAEADLKEVYAEVAGRRGKVSNVMQIHSLMPETMQSHLRLYMDIVYGKGTLTRLERELLAVVTSRANGCGYCTTHHKEALARYMKDPGMLDQVAEDWTQAALTARQRALCAHAVLLTRASHQVGEKDVRALRDAGLSDQEVLHATLVISYFNFVNRMVLGLGVPLESDDARTGYKY